MTTQHDKEGFPAYLIEVSDRGSKSVAVSLQDQTTESLTVPFLKDRGTFNISADTVRDTRTFTSLTGHGILVDEILEFANSITFMQARVLSIAVDTPTVGTDTITIDRLFNHSYVTADTFVRSTDDLRVNGSGTPQIFTVKPLPGQSGDITSITISIESTAAMDFSTFGGINALAVPCQLRVKREGGDYRNLFSFKTNGEFIENSAYHNFISKTGGGLFGFTATEVYGGQESQGVVIRIDGTLGEELQIVILDDLSVGLEKFRLVAHGHELQGD